MGSAPDVYAALKEELKDTTAEVLTPNSPGYAQSIKRWSDHCEKRAAAIVLPTSAAQICKIIKFIRANKIPFVVRGGGHSTSGSSSIEDGLVIDLSKMRKVTVDLEAKTIKAEGGTIWSDVDVEAAKYGLATVGGTVNHTGVGGLTLGGGYGYLTGQYGLTIDNLLSVDIVLASGDLVTASETENEHLFWAIRGAGQNFGVVTSFTFRGYEQGDVFASTLLFTADKLPQIIAFANKFHTTNTGSQALLFGFSTAPFPFSKPIVMTQLFHNTSDLNVGRSFFADLFALGALMEKTAIIPYSILNNMLNGTAGFGGRKQFGGGAFKLPLDIDFVEELRKDFFSFIKENEGMEESMILFEAIPYAKVREVSNESMSFSNRGDYYNLAVMFKWYDPTLDTKIRSYSRTLLKKASEPITTDPASPQETAQDTTQGVGVYGNYSDTSVPATSIYGPNTTRLEALKHEYDPENLFSRGTRLVPRELVVVN